MQRIIDLLAHEDGCHDKELSYSKLCDGKRFTQQCFTCFLSFACVILQYYYRFISREYERRIKAGSQTDNDSQQNKKQDNVWLCNRTGLDARRNKAGKKIENDRG